VEERVRRGGSGKGGGGMGGERGGKGRGVREGEYVNK